MMEKWQAGVMVRALLFFCVLFLCMLVQAEDFYAEGYIAADDKRVYIKDSIAVWNMEGNELTVYFYPFKVTEEDMKLFLENMQDDWRIDISYNKPSPDDLKWQWCPWGNIRVKFENTAQEKILKTISSVKYAFCSLTKKNYTMNHDLTGQKAQEIFGIFIIKKAENQDILEISNKGEYIHIPASFDPTARYSWDLKIRTKIYVPKVKEQDTR